MWGIGRIADPAAGVRAAETTKGSINGFALRMVPALEQALPRHPETLHEKFSHGGM